MRKTESKTKEIGRSCDHPISFVPEGRFARLKRETRFFPACGGACGETSFVA
jgi:hypothetical protein